jgi:ATP-dependent DNA helicase RecG
MEYIRVGSHKRSLKDLSEKERKLWSLFTQEPFEKGIALENATADEVLAHLNYPAYFELTKQSLPDNRAGILERLVSGKMIVAKLGSRFDITNFGAILFAKDLRFFERLSRKAVRVVIYKGKGRVETQREQENPR